MNILKKPWFYFLAIFLAGLLSGGILGATLVARQFAKPINLGSVGARVEKELTEKLDLDAEQRKKLHPLVKATMARLNIIYFETLGKIDAALRDAQAVLVADLRPDQIKKLGTLAKDRQDFIRQHNPLSPPVKPTESPSAP